MKPPTILDFVKRENDEKTWGGSNYGTIKVDGPKMLVYHTPAVHRQIDETVGRFLRPETQKLQFVMEAKFLTLSDAFFEKLGVDFTLNGNIVEGEDYSDIRTPVKEFLHPIPGPNGKPRSQTEGASVYWVAKEDIPKMFEKWNMLFGAAEGDTRSDFLSGLKLATFNGQLGAILDLSATEFTTDKTIVDGKQQPVVTKLHEGMSIGGFSLLSWDGRSVDSDVFVEFSKITKVERAEPKPGEIAIEMPHLASTTLSEQGLRWPVNGMLVVIMGAKRLSERRVEYGTPFLNKIPFGNRFFSNTAISRETQTIYSIVTIRMVESGENVATIPFQRSPIR